MSVAIPEVTTIAAWKRLAEDRLAGVEMWKEKAATAREAALEEAAAMLQASYPDNINTNAFCAAIRSLKIAR